MNSQMLQLSPRLQAILDLIVPGTTLADIGTDHAYVPAQAVMSGISPRAIASDINFDPICTARETLRVYELLDRVELRLGPGLEVLQPNEAGTIVIAGMGGTTICTILTDGIHVARAASRLVLQPMIRVAETRAWLNGHGFRIVDERMAKEGRHFYQIIAAESGAAPPLSPLELMYGPVLLGRRDPLLRQLAERDLVITDSAIAGLRKASTEQARLSEFVERRKRIVRLLNEW